MNIVDTGFYKAVIRRIDDEYTLSIIIDATGQQVGFTGLLPELVTTQLRFPDDRLPLIVDLVRYLKSGPPLEVVQLPETLFRYMGE